MILNIPKSLVTKYWSTNSFEFLILQSYFIIIQVLREAEIVTLEIVLYIDLDREFLTSMDLKNISLIGRLEKCIKLITVY